MPGRFSDLEIAVYLRMKEEIDFGMLEIAEYVVNVKHPLKSREYLMEYLLDIFVNKGAWAVILQSFHDLQGSLSHTTHISPCPYLN